MRRDLPTGTVTFLFTDIEGSTRLLHSLGADAYSEALAEHRRILRAAFVAHGGVEVDTQGDAFFVAFPTASGAADAARAGIAALAAGPVQVRIGLHTGVPTPAAEGYVGSDVHRGARVAALAHGGQIVLSPATASLLDGEALLDLGVHRIKDFEGTTRLFQLGTNPFPPLRAPGSVDLPSPPTRFIGRERELFDAVSLVYTRDPRVLTIVGPGGTGKTRFAIELAQLLAEDADGATVFVPLAPLRDPDLALPAIGERLGASSGDASTIAARVAGKRTHVVVDNVEQILPAAARSLAELVSAAPELRLLVTSREALRIQGEVELDLPPLADSEAVILFCDRADAVGAGVDPSRAVSDLCIRLDNLPLALELAAARTKLLTPETLLDRLGDRLDALRGTRDADERHSTLRATIAWSYDLLDADEQDLFRRFSAFRGSATIESAEHVCEADLDRLASLLDKSLVRRRPGRAAGEDRFWMLETIREYANELLASSGEEAHVRQRHAQRMLAVAASAHLSEDDGGPFDVAAGLVDREDFRAALDWALESDPPLGLRLVVALENMWVASGPAEGMRRIQGLLALTENTSPELRAGALRVLGGCSDLSGDRDQAERAWNESLELYRALDHDFGISALEGRLAVLAWRRDDWDRARELTEDSMERSRGRFAVVEITSLWMLGQLQLHADDVSSAIALTRQSAEKARELGWTWWESGQLHELLMLALRRGDLAEAELEGCAALRIEREQENRLWTVYTLAGLAQVALARDELERAGLLWGAAESEATHFLSWDGERARRIGTLAGGRGQSLARAYSKGRELDLWDAVAIALGELEPPQTEP
jgi:predicted ATPase/class 3 adenylate cyclase